MVKLKCGICEPSEICPRHGLWNSYPEAPSLTGKKELFYLFWLEDPPNVIPEYNTTFSSQARAQTSCIWRETSSSDFDCVFMWRNPSDIQPLLSNETLDSTVNLVRVTVLTRPKTSLNEFSRGCHYDFLKNSKLHIYYTGEAAPQMKHRKSPQNMMYTLKTCREHWERTDI